MKPTLPLPTHAFLPAASSLPPTAEEWARAFVTRECADPEDVAAWYARQLEVPSARVWVRRLGALASMLVVRP